MWPGAEVSSVQLVLLRVGGFGGSQPPVDLRLQFSLAFFHAIVARRLVPGCIRVDLRAFERHVTERHQTRRLLAGLTRSGDGRKCSAPQLTRGARLLLEACFA